MLESKPITTAIRLILTLVGLSLFIGCSEQPSGYVFTPTQRQHSTLAQATVDIVSSIYTHADQAATYLDRASLTDDYITLLPGGWYQYVLIDTVTGQPYTLYHYSYLDQKFYFLRFDPNPMPNAVRSPSSLQYTFVEINSYQNPLTNDFFGDISETRNLMLEYSNNRQDYTSIDGWFEVRKIVPFEEEIETAAGTYTYNVWVSVTWQIRIEHFSIDPNDQRTRLVIEGVTPIYDEAGDYHICHISGEINIDARGSGKGDIWFYGEPAIRLNFTGRSYGFNGNFTLFSENHRKSYPFE